MGRKVALVTLLVFAIVAGGAKALEEDIIIPDDCSGGTCPTPASFDMNACGLWLGPSPIKHAEEHGFGLGMFTGKFIPKGTTVESLYNGGEVILPLYGSQTIYETHPPLREYIWDEENMPEVAVEFPDTLTALFMPGLAAIAPCTSVNFNLAILGKGNTAQGSRDSVVSNSEGVHRSQHATSGSFAYRHNVKYVAIRDIVPGEELTVECSDDSYDGGAYFLSRFNSQDDALVCLDQNLRVGQSEIPSVGRGLFAKRHVPKGDILISTPLVPLHRKEMEIDDEDVNSKQLMLNYCYGHPDSDLLLLPYGPMVNYLNHRPLGKQANAEIRWHEVSSDKQKTLERREEHHHPELFEWSADKVAITHGKGLVMEVVALRDIKPGEEVYLDYGTAWQQAWESHAASWNKQHYDAEYMDAETYVHTHDDTIIHTETELARNPYPKNLETFCFYAIHKILGEDKEIPPTRYFSWTDDNAHSCFRPCRVLDRYRDRETDGGAATRARPGQFYTVELLREHNDRVVDRCVIAADVILTDVPSHGIRIMDRPYSTDVLLKSAFRHEIGVPEGFYPQEWMRKKVRRQPPAATDVGDEFKRKKNPVKTEEKK